MKIFTFHKLADIDINIRNLKLQTINFSDWKNGKSIAYSELHLWYDIDCGDCPCSWEDRSCDGECIDCGCCLAKEEQEYVPKIICILPNCIKNLLLKIKFRRWKDDN